MANVVVALDRSLMMTMLDFLGSARECALEASAFIGSSARHNLQSSLGFAEYAEPLTTDELRTIEAPDKFGANLQDALRQARVALHATPGRLIVFSRFEITSHLVDDGVDYEPPPAPEALDATIEELEASAQEGIMIDAFRFHQPEWSETPCGEEILTTIERLGGTTNDVSRESALTITRLHLGTRYS